MAVKVKSLKTCQKPPEFWIFVRLLLHCIGIVLIKFGICNGLVWYGLVFAMVWYGMVWYLQWYGMLWYRMCSWYGMVWLWYRMCSCFPLYALTLYLPCILMVTTAEGMTGVQIGQHCRTEQYCGVSLKVHFFAIIVFNLLQIVSIVILVHIGFQEIWS